MIYHDLELHNVRDVEESGCGAVLQRFPKKVREHLEKRRNFRAEMCAGVEIRVVTEASCMEIILKCLYGDGVITVFRGVHPMYTLMVQGGQTVTLHLEPPENWESLQMPEQERFSPFMWRIHLPAAQFAIQHVESYGQEYRPPISGESPTQTLLAYGSSITQGCFAQNNLLAYPQYAAELLGWDVLNLGLSGACYCEKEMFDFIAEESWDFAFLELGVNMRPFFSTEEFEQRFRYGIETLCSSHPQTPVLLTTIYPNAQRMERGETLVKKRDAEYDEVIRRYVRASNWKNLFLTEGIQISSGSFLGTDMLHPGDLGHLAMGRNLADLCKRILCQGPNA